MAAPLAEVAQSLGVSLDPAWKRRVRDAAARKARLRSLAPEREARPPIKAAPAVVDYSAPAYHLGPPEEAVIPPTDNYWLRPEEKSLYPSTLDVDCWVMVQ
jgi:hypothetical protein